MRLLIITLTFLLLVPVVQAAPQTIVLENTRVKFSFVHDDGKTYLDSMTNKDTGKVFGTEKVPLLYFTIRDSDAKKIQHTINQRPHTFSHSTKQISGGQELTLLWSNVEITTPANTIETLNFTGQIVLKDNEPTADFWIESKTNTPTSSLYDVTFPSVFFTSLSDTQDEAYILPHVMGQLVINPRKSAFKNQLFKHLAWSQTQTYQLNAWYTVDDEEMIYTQTKDSLGYTKFHVQNLTEGGIGFAITHLPENHLTANIDYTAPYSVVLGTFKGDWYDAAAYYRSWAIQHFVPRGKLETSKDVSPLVDIFDFKVLLSIDEVENQKDRLIRGIQEVQDFEDFFNLCPDPNMPEYKCDPSLEFSNTSIEVYMWHSNNFQKQYDWPLDYKPIHSAVRELVRQSHLRGDYVIPYTIAIEYDTESPSFNNNVRSHGQINESGDYAFYPNSFDPQRNSLAIDPTTQFWQDLTRDIMVDHTDFGDDDPSYAGTGFDGAYWDVFSATPAFTDYSTDRGHPQGGGNYWLQGEKERVKKARDAAKAKKSIWYQESEHPTEFFVNDFEFVQYNSPSLIAAPFYNIPLFSTLFHDYTSITTIIASYPNATKYNAGNGVTNDYANMVWAHYYSYGVFPSVANPILDDEHTFPLQDKDDEFYNFLKKIVRSYSYAKQYTLYGQLLRPLDIDVDSHAYVVPNNYYKGYTSTTPHVYSSVWKASDGSLAIMLINWWNTPEEVEFTFDFSDYDLDKGKTYYLHELGETETLLKGNFSDSFEYTITIPKRHLTILRLTSNSANSPECTPNQQRSCGPSTTQGSCGKGIQTCSAQGFWEECKGAVYPKTEICGNNIDEDCDGSDKKCLSCTDTDKDGFSVEGGSCGPADCNDNNAAIHPNAKEVCDKRDNNCDGKTDEGCSCSPGETQPCGGGSAIGICKAGERECQSNGVWGSCVGEVKATDEICSNQLDDDCDGQTDEGCVDTCQNGIKDGDEIGIDCGGSCRDCTPLDTENLGALVVVGGVLAVIILFAAVRLFI